MVPLKLCLITKARDNFLSEVNYFNRDFSGKCLAECAFITMKEIIRIQHLSSFRATHVTYDYIIDQIQV